MIFKQGLGNIFEFSFPPWELSLCARGLADGVAVAGALLAGLDGAGALHPHQDARQPKREARAHLRRGPRPK